MERLAQRMPVTDQCRHPAEGDMRAQNRGPVLTPLLTPQTAN
jgi:hypothetical protein